MTAKPKPELTPEAPALEQVNAMLAQQLEQAQNIQKVFEIRFNKVNQELLQCELEKIQVQNQAQKLELRVAELEAALTEAKEGNK